jgi:hypothetical protein
MCFAKKTSRYQHTEHCSCDPSASELEIGVRVAPSSQTPSTQQQKQSESLNLIEGQRSNNPETWASATACSPGTATSRTAAISSSSTLLCTLGQPQDDFHWIVRRSEQDLDHVLSLSDSLLCRLGFVHPQKHLRQANTIQ